MIPGMLVGWSQMRDSGSSTKKSSGEDVSKLKMGMEIAALKRIRAQMYGLSNLTKMVVVSQCWDRPSYLLDRRRLGVM